MNKKFERSDIRFLVLILVAHAIFFAIALYYKKIFNGDSAEYIYMALNIKEHFWFYAGNPVFQFKEEYLTLRTPGYSLFIMLVYLFTVNNWIVLVLQNLISVFNIYYLRDTIRKTGFSRKYDWILMAFVLLYPSQFVNANTIAPDILLQTFVLVYFRHFVLLITLKQWNHAFWMSLALIAGTMVKPVLYPFAYIHCLIMLWVTVYVNGGLVRAFITAMIPICAVLLYGYWNDIRTEKFHFSSTQSFNAIYYYYPYIKQKEGVDSADRFLAHEHAIMDTLPDFRNRYTYANQRGMQLLKENFILYMMYHIQYSAWTFMSPGKGELDLFTGRLTLSKLYGRIKTKKRMATLSESIKIRGFDGFRSYIFHNPSFPVAILILFFNFLRLIGLMLFLFIGTINSYIRIFVCCLIGYFSFAAGPISHPRYFIPISLIAIGCATLGYQYLLQRQKNKLIDKLLRNNKLT